MNDDKMMMRTTKGERDMLSVHFLQHEENIQTKSNNNENMERNGYKRASKEQQQRQRQKRNKGTWFA